MGEFCLVGCSTPDSPAQAVQLGRPASVNWGSTTRCCRPSSASLASRRVATSWPRAAGPGSAACCTSGFSRSQSRFVTLPGAPGAPQWSAAHERRHSSTDSAAAVCASFSVAVGVASITEEEVRTADSQTRDGGQGWLTKTRAMFKIPKQLSSPAQIRELLMKMGCSAVLAYGFTSNVSNICLVVASWYLFWMRTGLSPLTQGQFGAFLLTYIAMYGTIGNLLRPLRIVIAAALGPTFDGIVDVVQDKLNINKTFAIATTCLLVNGCGSAVLLTAGIFGASAITGMPILPTPSMVPVAA